MNTNITMKTVRKPHIPRQHQIVAAAVALIEEGGMDALTVKAIGARVGFSDAAVYRHFASKGAILGAIADRFAVASLRLLDDLRSGGSDSLALVRQFFLDRLKVFATDPVALAVMFSEDLFRSEPELAAKVDQIMVAHQRILMDSLASGQRRGEIVACPCSHLFLAVIGALRLLVSQWRASGRSFDLIAAGEALWATLAALLAHPNGGKNP